MPTFVNMGGTLMEFGWVLCHHGLQILILFKTNCSSWPRRLFITPINVILQLLVEKDTMFKIFIQRSYTFELLKFHDFFHDLFKFSKTLALAGTFKNF